MMNMTFMACDWFEPNPDAQIYIPKLKHTMKVVDAVFFFIYVAEMLLKWVQEEEQNIAGSGDKDLFRVDEAQIDVSEGEEAAQAHILKVLSVTLYSKCTRALTCEILCADCQNVPGGGDNCC